MKRSNPRKNRTNPKEKSNSDESFFLTPLEKRSPSRPFVTFDLESKAEDSQLPGFTRPFLVGLYDGEKFVTFRDSAEAKKNHDWQGRNWKPGGCIDRFLRYLFKHYPDHDVYAHNLGNFDGLFLPTWLMRHQDKYGFEVIPVQSSILMLEVWERNLARKRTTRLQRKQANERDRKDMPRWRFLDSFKVMPLSLDAMIRMFKLRDEGKSGKVTFDLGNHEDHPGWDEYNQADTELLYRAIERYRQLVFDKLHGDIGISAPATAMKTFRLAYLDRKLTRHRHFRTCKDESCLGCAHEFFRRAYHGGRTEIYTANGSDLAYYDINSSYPASMLEPQPVGAMIVKDGKEDISDEVLRAGLGRLVGFVECTVDVPKGVYLPVLPLEWDGKLMFPTGTFSGVWNWHELQLLFCLGGHILRIERSVWIEAEPVLANFARSLYALRDKTRSDYDPSLSEVAKIMANSLFGKFGMHPVREKVLILEPGDSAPKGARIPGKMRTLDFPDGPVFYGVWSPIRLLEQHIDAPYIIPQIAANITSLSRVRLWKLARYMLARGGRIFYSDTDSLITDRDDYPDETHLGGCKKEFGPEKISFAAVAPKTYHITKEKPFKGMHLLEAGRRTCGPDCPGCNPTKVMMKGIPRDLKTLEAFKLLTEGKRITFKRLEKFGALARRSFADTPKMVETSKSFRPHNDKRVMDARGESVPHHIDDPQALSATFREKGVRRPKWLQEIERSLIDILILCNGVTVNPRSKLVR